MSSDQSPVAAGWYPTGDGEQRYWDGAAWTQDVAPLTEPSGATVSGGLPVKRLVAVLFGAVLGWLVFSLGGALVAIGIWGYQADHVVGPLETTFKLLCIYGGPVLGGWAGWRIAKPRKQVPGQVRN